MSNSELEKNEDGYIELGSNTDDKDKAIAYDTVFSERSNSKAESTPTIEGLVDTLRLQSQCSSIAPGDWEDESKYDHENIKIWNAWLTFLTNSEIKTRPLVCGAELLIVPPCLSWYIRTEKHVSIVMHFLTMEEGHGYKNQINVKSEYLNHTSNALRSDDSLQSICYKQICHGCTDELLYSGGSSSIFFATMNPPKRLFRVKEGGNRERYKM